MVAFTQILLNICRIYHNIDVQQFVGLHPITTHIYLHKSRVSNYFFLMKFSKPNAVLLYYNIQSTLYVNDLITTHC